MNCQDLFIDIGRRVDKIPTAHRDRYKLVLGPGIYAAVVLQAQEAAHNKGPKNRIPVVKRWSGVTIELDEKYGPLEWRVV